ncbi:MAG: SpaH/EbpB family LPXTG-anchored major pilin [Clostridiales bacterium]|nr:SpaH/EbpB family LPXTG-anchored major pilin [Candidatus Crickella caballi]
MIKKLTSLLLALCVILSMSATVFAADSSSITLTGAQEGHTFEAYQVFKGTKDGTNLNKIQWGDGVDSDALLTDLKKLDAYKDCKTAAAVAKVLSEQTTATAADDFAKIVAKHLVAAKAKTGTSDEDGKCAINVGNDGYYFVKDTTDVDGEDDSITKFILKVVGNETVEVKADKPGVDKVIAEADSANGQDGKGTAVNVGDTVTFKVTSTVPKMDGYTSYDFIVNDTMSEGLTLVDDSVKITIDGKDYTAFTEKIDGQKITITFNDFINQKDNAGKAIVISYDAVLNSKALTTDKENNTVKLTYSNNPNDTSKHGTTPEKKTYVFDFDLVIDKYDGADSTKATKLEGAKFVLMNADGKYYSYDADNKKVVWVDSQDDATPKTTDANGATSFIGIDAGTYQLVETEAPEGYNLIKDPVEVKITATYNKDGTLADSSATIENNGQYKQTAHVENNSGMVLPSTGGIGTKIFYGLGSLLAIAAVILLVSRKRMSNDAK